MFTDNYIKYRQMLFFNRNTTYPMYFTSITGDSVGAYFEYSNTSDIGMYMHQGFCGEPNGGVYFGSGSTPATRADYNLESVITSGLTITNPSAPALTSEGEGKYVVQSPFTVHNNSDAEIVIREIGYFGVVSPQSGAYHRQIVLFERTVLDEPIVIPAGQGKLVTYKIVFNQF